MARKRRRLPEVLHELPEGTIIPPELPPHPTERFSAADAAQIQELIEHLAHLRMESLRLYAPLPKTNIFHESDARVRLLIGSNRAGKTLAAAVELARAITGQDPYNKYPKTNGVFFIFGLDERHIGNTIYKKVFRAGAFKMVKDPVTNVWRAFSPVADAALAHLAKPAPPLVPQRFIKNIAWREKKAHVPKIISMVNGWEIHFFSSLAELPQGQDIDGWWIDEEVRRETVIEELLPRCADRRGRGWWSATPQVASTQLYDLHDRANSGSSLTANSAISEDGDVIEVHCHIVDNPHIEQAEKERLYRGWNEDQRKVRWDGKFAFSSFLVYPEFSLSVHAWPQNEGWQVPHEWSKFFVVDPGRQRCAVLFVAKPPPYIGNFYVAYDELYIKDCDADRFGRGVAEKSHERVYDLAIIDSHAGRISEMGSGRNIEEQYRQALIRHKVQFRNGPAFIWGADDVDAGIQAVREWLRIGSAGQPSFFLHLARCPNLKWEFERYRFKADPVHKVPTDVPIKKYDHLLDCLRYAAMRSPSWRKPKDYAKKLSPLVDVFRRKQARRAAKASSQGSDHVSLGMGKSR